MAEIKVTVSLNEFTVRIIDGVAAKMWPEFSGNRSALYRKIVADWHRIRFENGGGRTSRIEKLEEWKEVQESEHLPERMALVERRLGIGTYDDTDHG